MEINKKNILSHEIKVSQKVKNRYLEFTFGCILEVFWYYMPKNGRWFHVARLAVDL